MKRHTNKHIKSLGLVLAILALGAGVGSFISPTWAQTVECSKDKVSVAAEDGTTCATVDDTGLKATAEADVQFTFNSTITLTINGKSEGVDGITIGSLLPGATGESDPVTVKVDTNNATGYKLTATAGTKSTNTDLSGGGLTFKFTMLTCEQDNCSDENGQELSAMSDDTWGVAFVEGEGSFGTTKYTGLPQDQDDQGATGKELLSKDAPSAEGNSVQVKVGAKAGATMQPGTYTNVINFYATANPAPAPQE